MTLDERSRHHLHQRLEETLGPDAASTMMEYLPPVGWAGVATKHDLDNLAAITKRDLDGLGATLRAEFYKETASMTRTIVFANIGAVLTTATLAFAAARLA